MPADLTLTQESLRGATVYRAQCPTCGFVTGRYHDTVWAAVVGSRHRCSGG